MLHVRAATTPSGANADWGTVALSALANNPNGEIMRNCTRGPVFRWQPI
jgi:hypothetical protein